MSRGRCKAGFNPKPRKSNSIGSLWLVDPHEYPGGILRLKWKKKKMAQWAKVGTLELKYLKFIWNNSLVTESNFFALELNKSYFTWYPWNSIKNSYYVLPTLIQGQRQNGFYLFLCYSLSSAFDFFSFEVERIPPITFKIDHQILIKSFWPMGIASDGSWSHFWPNIFLAHRVFCYI